MPVRIRLSRVGAKKRPIYRIVVADSRRSRDGKFIDRIGTYNPMLSKDHPERIKINIEKAKEWIQKGAQPSDRVHLFLSNFGVLAKPIITEKTKKHLPKKKAQERKAAIEKVKEIPKSEDKDKTSVEATVSKESSDSISSTEDKKISKENEEKQSEDISVNTKPDEATVSKESSDSISSTEDKKTSKENEEKQSEDISVNKEFTETNDLNDSKKIKKKKEGEKV